MIGGCSILWSHAQGIFTRSMSLHRIRQHKIDLTFYIPFFHDSIAFHDSVYPNLISPSNFVTFYIPPSIISSTIRCIEIVNYGADETRDNRK